MKFVRLLICLLGVLTPAGHAAAQSICTSDNQTPALRLMERFTSADCASCWSEAATAAATLGTVVLDWVVPGLGGDEAPLSAVASSEAVERLNALGKRLPERTAVTVESIALAPGLKQSVLRVARGLAISGYIGVSIELGPTPTSATGQPLTAWLALVEVLPAGTESSPVERHLVRGVFQSLWTPKTHWPGAVPSRLFEQRSISVTDGVNVEQLQVIGWLTDSRGRILRATQSQCAGMP